MSCKPLLRLMVLALALAGCAAAHAYQVSDIVNLVSQTSYTDFLDDSLYTHDGDDRGFGPQHDLAQTSIFNAFQSFGLDTSLDPFDYFGTYYNVVGVHRGLTDPDKIWVISGHYDSVNNPGADDDGSGVAGVMEAARVLSRYQFADTIVFIGFDREEQGTRGSKAYTNEHSTDNIQGMIDLDMIAYNPDDPAYHDKVSLWGGRRDWYPEFRASIGDAVAQWGGGLTPVIQGGTAASDHQHFEDWSWRDCLMAETAMDAGANPNYHQLTDSVDTPNYIDYKYATNITRSAVGFLATNAGDVPEPTSLALFAAGLLALVVAARRRSR